MNQDLLALTPELVMFVRKLVQHSRGGLTQDERQELVQDLFELLYKILKELIDADEQQR
jgi:DNA-directed RNA polymerase specialized sigma24 family protein|tara:strand:+ start:932 stop:1108 length:177 start_codon:yes stop_codon:yes gene_type:complete